MDYRTKYKRNKVVFTITVVILGISLGWTIGALLFKPKSNIVIFHNNIIKDSSKNFNEKDLLEFMYLLEIKHPKIVLAQAKHETGNYTSNRFIKHNALFGFQISDTNIIKYKSWKESVIAYKCWQMKRLREDEDYYKFLVRVKYANDSNYIKKLKQY